MRVRGNLLVTDGPFTESKEWIAGFDVLDCADLDEAVEIARAFLVSEATMGSGCSAPRTRSLTLDRRPRSPNRIAFPSGRREFLR